MDSMRQKIADALETENVTVQDASGDGQHVVINVVSDMFEDKTLVQRQRMVYKVGTLCIIICQVHSSPLYYNLYDISST